MKDISSPYFCIESFNKYLTVSQILIYRTHDLKYSLAGKLKIWLHLTTRYFLFINLDFRYFELYQWTAYIINVYKSLFDIGFK